MSSSYTEIVTRLRDFAAQRDWEQFHDPKNLAMAIASEAGELLAELRWVSNTDADAHVVGDHRAAIEQEVADIAISLIMFCERTGIDIFHAIDRKIAVNEERYPVHAARGRSERPEKA